MSFVTLNPATGETIQRYDGDSREAVLNKLMLSGKAFLNWSNTSFEERSLLMNRAAGILRSNKDEYAALMALEMGKPLAQGLSEVEKCAWVCEYYAGNAPSFLADEIIPTEMSRSYVTFNPLGPVLAIMPWNFPFWQVFRFAAPALMAGNTGVLKHARNTMGCAIAIEKLFLGAGFPEGVFTNLVIGPEPVAEIISNDIIRAVTLTGSTPVGQQTAAAAGAAVKKTVLELGGSDPYVILEDADIAKAAKICASARLINSGQSCIAAKRFIVVRPVLEEFEELLTREMEAARVGDPFDPSNDVGPQARADLRDSLHHQVESSVAMGAKLLTGGRVPEGRGFFYPPTVLTNVTKGMAAYCEETFGPVAAVIPAENEDDAVAKANDSVFGLGAAVFTSDIGKGNLIARNKLNAGACFVNSSVRSDPRLPFGGVKMSGYGRELSHFGIKEFTNIKTVCI